MNRSRTAIFCLLSSLTVSIACDTDVTSTDEIQHPSAENLPNEAILLKEGGERGGPEIVTRLRMVGRRPGSADTLGEVEGVPEYVFGEIMDMRSVGENLLVLDGRFNSLRLFGPDGGVLTSFGKPGPGPAELARPIKIVRADSGRVTILDRGAEAKTFRSTDSGWALDRFARLPFMPEDACTRSALVYVRAWHSSGRSIHAFAMDEDDPSGVALQPKASWGRTYLSSSPIVSQQLTQGLVACTTSADFIVEAGTYLPYIRTHGIAGGESAVFQLANFRSMNIVERRRGGGQSAVTLDGSAGYDVMRTLVILPGGYVLVQVLQIDLPPGGTLQDITRGIRSYVVDLHQAVAWYVGNTLPRVLDLTSDRLYGAITDPFPAVVTVEY